MTRRFCDDLRLVPRRKTPKPETQITIAIDGDGIAPANVGLRQLAQLLEATAATLDAIADERKLEAPKLCLTRVKHGSAAYELVSADRQAPRVVQSFVSTVRRRGKGSSPRTRTSLQRLHSVAAKTGVLRLDPVSRKADVNPKPVYLAAPIDDDEIAVEEGTLEYGRVVGIRLDAHDRASVTLRYDDGGQGQFDAGPDLVEKAARLIGKNVAARVTYMRGEQRDFEGSVEELEERPAPSSFMYAITEARRMLQERGVVVDAKAWLEEEREE